MNVFNEIIVSEALAEEQFVFIENMTPEVSLTVLKTFKAIFYSFTKIIIFDDESKIALKVLKYLMINIL